MIFWQCINNEKNKAKKILIKSYAKIILIITKFRENSIKDEGAKKLAQGL
jgi:hypothetical protein